MNKYELNPEESFYENVLKVFRMKMEHEKVKFDYINPHMMSEILEKLENYGRFEADDDIWDWIVDMYQA
jgi:hypothetical protein